PSFIVVASNLAGQLLALSYVMENTFLGLPGQARRFFVTARLLANLVWIVGSLRHISKHNHSQEIAKNLFGLLLKRLTHIQTEFGEDFNLNQLGDFQSRLQRAHDNTTVTTITPLFDYIESFVPPAVDFRNLLKRSDAVIIEPAYQSTTEQVFNSEFPLRIRIIADVFNVADTGSIGVQVTFPDQKVRQFWPPSSQFVLIKPFYYRLKTSIEISQSSWTAKCSIEIKIIRSFETDIPDLDECILRQTITRDVVSTTSGGTIALSKSILWDDSLRFGQTSLDN
ncbi:9583_t:CDS:2, partial [Paraglomus brasilianum]